MEKKHLKLPILILIILAAAFSRLIPHIPNFSAFGAIALFGAAHLQKKWQVFLIPAMALWLSSLVIDNVYYAADYTGFVWFYEGFHWQLLSYFAIGALGLFLFKKEVSVMKTGIGALSAGLIFFIVTNFGVWMTSSLYEPTLSGLATCFTAAIPFYRATMLGDVLFTFVLFGGYYLAQQKFDFLKDNRSGTMQEVQSF
ncbi:MAG: hypothetical protein KDK41_17220 [Leptospiraceae bacterium]|nr:hypothetical protein [Leptospiraceae bacterium]